MAIRQLTVYISVIQLHSMDLRSLLCPIALNNMASILQVPTLTIALLSDVSCGPKLAVVSSQLLCIDVDIQYFLFGSHYIIKT